MRANRGRAISAGVNWLMPPMEQVTPQSIRRSKRVLNDFIIIRASGENDPVPEEERHVHQSEAEPVAGKGKRTVAKWKELMSYPSEDLIEKTLESTTQMQVEPVESERREIPRQHCKKRIRDN